MIAAVVTRGYIGNVNLVVTRGYGSGEVETPAGGADDWPEYLLRYNPYAIDLKAQDNQDIQDIVDLLALRRRI